MNKTRILFVCYGNICRSPAAQGICEHLIKHKKLTKHFEVDSAGTHGFHIGKKPDERSITAAKKQGVDISTQSARQFLESDFDRFDVIYVMDHKNKDFLVNNWPIKDHNKIIEFIKFGSDTSRSHIHDPYYDTAEAFDDMTSLLFELCNNCLAHHCK